MLNLASLLLVAAAPVNADAAPDSVKSLFMQSLDGFTLILVLGSVVAVAIMVRCVLEIRASSIMPPSTERRIRELANDHEALRSFVANDETFVASVVRAALGASARPGSDRSAMRDAAELAASEECSKYFRKIEPLNIIGNLGTLVGLAGTVYGMITAFSALGQAGGQASPAALSSGIAKALFHTLLGLLLALPALTFFGFYRSIVDRICTRGMVVSSELVELLPEPKQKA